MDSVPTPVGMEPLLADHDSDIATRAMTALLQMKKTDIAALQRA